MRLSHSLQIFLSFSVILDLLFKLAKKRFSPKKVSFNEEEKEGKEIVIYKICVEILTSLNLKKPLDIRSRFYPEFASKHLIK